MLKALQLTRSFARRTAYRVKKSRKNQRKIKTSVPNDEMRDIQNQIDHIKSTRRTIKKFEQRNLERFTKNELKVMRLGFDQVTEQINNGQLDIKTFEAERIKRKLSQNFNAYEYESRLRNRLEHLMLEIGDNIQFPWNFNGDFQPEQAKNLDTVYAIDNILEKDTMEAVLRQFIRGIVEKDYARIRDVSEQHLVKRVRKNI